MMVYDEMGIGQSEGDKGAQEIKGGRGGEGGGGARRGSGQCYIVRHTEIPILMGGIHSFILSRYFIHPYHSYWLSYMSGVHGDPKFVGFALVVSDFR